MTTISNAPKPDAGLFIILPEREPTLAHRMLVYVHSRGAIARARGLAFWEMFRRANRDVRQLKPSELRFMFFAEVLHEPDYCDEPTFYDGWYDEEQRQLIEGGHEREG
ncbi:uncharacterized protein LOC128092482 [Culex pipiens pallens]|uniref:uncharacterized protein LOC128092482 n=1 Tax=Culex pipiens pallens TaxID=42434 RepID=UPI0022AB2BB6|nr:uncharacterized protein LOC128092482 [Culex pipiens pallens]